MNDDYPKSAPETDRNDTPPAEASAAPGIVGGSSPNLQPSDALMQETAQDPTLLQPNVSQHVAEAGQIYVSADTSPTPEDLPPNKTFKRYRLLAASLACLTVIAGATVAVYATRHKQSASLLSSAAAATTTATPRSAIDYSTPTGSPSSGATAPTPLETKLANHPDQLAALRAFTLPILVPADKNINQVSIGGTTDKSNPIEQINFGIKRQYGRGLLPGTYGVSERTRDVDYNPPANCGGNNFADANSPVSCTPYAGAAKDMPAYVHNGRLPLNITDSAIPDSSYVTLYVNRGNEIITIESSDTSADALYKMVRSWTQIKPVDLPADATVMFYTVKS